MKCHTQKMLARNRAVMMDNASEIRGRYQLHITFGQAWWHGTSVQQQWSGLLQICLIPSWIHLFFWKARGLLLCLLFKFIKDNVLMDNSFEQSGFCFWLHIVFFSVFPSSVFCYSGRGYWIHQQCSDVRCMVADKQYIISVATLFLTHKIIFTVLLW